MLVAILVEYLEMYGVKSYTINNICKKVRIYDIEEYERIKEGLRGDGFLNFKFNGWEIGARIDSRDPCVDNFC